MKIKYIALILTLLLLSCKRLQQVQHITRDSVYTDHIDIHHDSVYSYHYKNTYTYHDTVHVVDSVFTFAKRQITQKDTIFSNRVDTVILTNPQKKGIHGYSSAFTWTWIIIAIALFILSILLIIKFTRHLHNN